MAIRDGKAKQLSTDSSIWCTALRTLQHKKADNTNVKDAYSNANNTRAQCMLRDGGVKKSLGGTATITTNDNNNNNNNNNNNKTTWKTKANLRKKKNQNSV